MPHKRNPVLTENLTGIARIVRAAVVPALENVALWHERDISHSSVERVFAPDATIALTHRDPVSVIQSAVTMLAYGQRNGRKKVEPQRLIEYWSDRVEHLLRACVRDRAVIPAEQSIDVLFHEFMADDLKMVERIYEKAGDRMGEVTRGELQAFLDEHPRGKYGRVVYDLRGDFGVDPEALRERFGFYFDAFAVEREPA